MPNYRKPTDKETEKLNKSRKMMVEGIEGEKDIFSKTMPTMAKAARDEIRAAKALRETVPASAREGEAYQSAGYKKGGKVKKMRKFEEGGLAASAYGSGLLGSMKNSSNKKTSSFSEAHDKALRIGLEPGSEDYRLAMDSQMRNPAERSRNQALEKVKSTAMAAGKRLMDMTPQGAVAKGVTSMARKYPRYSEGESSFEQEMGMKKGGKVSSASKRADGIAIRGKTRA
jgi:hypothetical protein